MPRFKNLLRWLGFASDGTEFESWVSRQPAPSITFKEITDVGSPPANELVQGRVFYRVLRDEKEKWALFLCPCGCGAVITLSLQHVHRPHWEVRLSRKRRPSLRPSVWRDIGCLSHFWIEDGRVYWCGNSGSSPWVRKTRKGAL